MPRMVLTGEESAVPRHLSSVLTLHGVRLAIRATHHEIEHWLEAHPEWRQDEVESDWDDQTRLESYLARAEYDAELRAVIRRWSDAATVRNNSEAATDV